jgi:hypothetical protein
MKVVLGLILYVIILSVLVYNNQLLSYRVLAESEESTTQEDSEDEVEENEGSEEDNGQEEDNGPNPTSRPPDLPPGELDPIPGPPAHDFDPDLNPHDMDIELNSDTRSLDPQSDEQSDDRGQVTGLESDEEKKFTHNARLIAMELSELSPVEISQYPISDLSNEDIKLVFGYLTPGNIAKVLMNISQEDLVKIQSELTPTYFDRILLIRLPEVERTQVQDRIFLASDQN